jgi:hypothetical protein
MGYFDGNTVTALWSYAQRFAMSDNFFSTTFGPSIPGHLNLISGQTHGAMPANIKGVVNGTVIANPDPLYDNCSDLARLLINMSGANIGDLLNVKDVTWGWFSDGFRLPNKISSSTSSSSDIKVNCDSRQDHTVVTVKHTKIIIQMSNHSNTTSLQPILCICFPPQMQLLAIKAIKPITNTISLIFGLLLTLVICRLLASSSLPPINKDIQDYQIL